MTPWRRIPLGELTKSVDYGVTASATEQPSGPKFLRITDIQNGAVNWDTVPWCECGSRSAADSRLEPGDIVFARTGATTGKSFLIRHCPADAVFASYLIRVRFRDVAEPRFVSHFFQTQDYWEQIAKGARGLAQPGVNATTLRTIEVPLPPIGVQRKIAEILDRADALRLKRRAALTQLQALTHSIFLHLMRKVGPDVPTLSIEEGMDEIIDYRGKSPAKTAHGVPLITARVMSSSPRKHTMTG